ncbi:glutaredoxin [Lindgomyces ingoldianus]|uniref:Glutaredoxin n=1 Tax=Lindgomyces ingoldianus TaxID=673940 RepID=A0ACB6Q8J2_9PLEO|nr:glutaredoxin [Lindgomyces ingoldianus]KAF2463263.1 glutaredoxin [Lindgomyces ingoldianus]
MAGAKRNSLQLSSGSGIFEGFPLTVNNDLNGLPAFGVAMTTMEFTRALIEALNVSSGSQRYANTPIQHSLKMRNRTVHITNQPSIAIRFQTPFNRSQTDSKFLNLISRPTQPTHHQPRPRPPTTTLSFLRSFFKRAPSPATMSATKTKVQGIIDENPVAVFSKSFCPFCKATKQLLSENGVKFYAIELDQVDDGSAIQSTLAELTGQTTVPNIFINKQHIGGNSDLQARKGELPQLLANAAS